MVSVSCFEVGFCESNVCFRGAVVALDFASTYDNITIDERNIIIHAKKSTLIYKQQPWQKKGDTTFDVTMGSYDGAETTLFRELPHSSGV